MPCRPCPNSPNIELLVLCSVQLIIIILLENATPKMLDTKCSRGKCMTGKIGFLGFLVLLQRDAN